MKIGGQPLPRATGVVTLTRHGKPVATVKVRGVPFSFCQRVSALFPVPPAPRRLKTKPGTGHVVRGVNGQAEWYDDESDPEYVTTRSEMELLRQTYTVAVGLEEDPTISWDTPRTLRETNPVAYARALVDEFDASGMTPGDLIAIQDAILGLSNLTSTEVKEAAEGFLSEASSEAAPGESLPEPLVAH